MNDILFYGLSAVAIIIMLKFLGINLSIFDDLANKEFLYYKRHPNRSGRRGRIGDDSAIGGYYCGGGGDAGGDGGD